MKIGASPWKVRILGLLVLVLGFGIYWNLTSDDRPPAARAATAPRPAANRSVPPEVAADPPTPETRPRPPLRPEPRPLRLNPKETHADPATVDPTLRLDLLAKVQQVSLAGGERNLFQFGSAPPPPVPERKIIPTAIAPSALGTPPGGVQPVDPPKPPPPPIPLKFYGYSNNPQPGVKRAFFLAQQGDEIFVAKEGELIQRRYKVVKIGVSSCMVEDTSNSNQQSLPIEVQPG